ncbi:GNAT family N-acetyltransferase [Cytobacillus suaedae]|nr:GNAT family N-acetyltransferase [Cytobacillus suaedae]
MVIREIRYEDAECFVALIKQVEAESEFMLMEPGERKLTTEQQQNRIEQMNKDGHSAIFVAEQEDGKLVGYLFAIGGSARKTKHTAYLVIGILRDYRGMGIGTKLFQNAEEWAKSRNISRLELTVVTENKPGIGLYQKMGFEIEGTKRNSLMINGKPMCEYMMSKLL